MSRRRGWRGGSRMNPPSPLLPSYNKVAPSRESCIIVNTPLNRPSKYRAKIFNTVPNFSMMCDLLLSSLEKTRFVVTVFGHGKKWPAILAVEFGRPLVQQIPCQEKVFNFWTSARINRAKMPDFLFGTVFAEGKKWLKWTKMAEMSQFLEMVRNFDLPKWQSGLKKWLKWANFEKWCVNFFKKWIIFTHQKS